MPWMRTKPRSGRTSEGRLPPVCVEEPARSPYRSSQGPQALSLIGCGHPITAELRALTLMLALLSARPMVAANPPGTPGPEVATGPANA
jgi:hypothetical protein